MNAAWDMRTGRLALTPVGLRDLPDLARIKADPRVFGLMLGGVRSALQTAMDLAADTAAWAANGYGLWAVRELSTGAFIGVAGLTDRPDGRGTAVRFAVWPDAQGRGLAREAAAAALRYGHAEAGLARIIGVARETNFASLTVLGAIGMRQAGTFVQGGWTMILFESVRE